MSKAYAPLRTKDRTAFLRRASKERPVRPGGASQAWTA